MRGSMVPPRLEERRWRPGRPPRGFTLLEVMVAMSILAISLVVILNSQSNAIMMTNYVKNITVAALLARSKVIDFEEVVREEGWGSFEEEEIEGDFEEEGIENYWWSALLEKVEIPIPDSGEALQEMAEGFKEGKEGNKTGSKATDKPEETTNSLNLDLLGMGGDASTMIQGVDINSIVMFLPMINDFLEQRMRRVTFAIHWKEGRQEKELTVSYYLTESQDGQGGTGDFELQGDAAGGVPGVPGMGGVMGGSMGQGGAQKGSNQGNQNPRPLGGSGKSPRGGPVQRPQTGPSGGFQRHR